MRTRSYGTRLGLTASGWLPLHARDAADAFLAAWLAALTSRQETYQAANGRYWQGLVTHAAAVAYAANHDGSAAADRLATKPHYQAEDWLAVLPEWEGLSLPATVRVDQYVGPQGKGWVLTLELTHGGVRYARAVNTGPETYRDSPWAVVPPFQGGG